MTGRGIRRSTALAIGLALALSHGGTRLSAVPLTEAGRRAYETAQKADDEAAAALEEGSKTLALIKTLVSERDEVPLALKPLLDEGDAARQALDGYRKLAQGSSTDALALLGEVSKMPTVPTPDVVRRDTLEQHALLAAHEASVMSARARAEAERLRAILAEARLATVKGESSARGAGGTPAADGGGRAAMTSTGSARGAAVVPNLVGARLEAAVRDLEAAGLRLGPVTGPRDGFIVKQSPDAGEGAARQSVVSVTLSGTAATVAPLPASP